jgi:tripeptidyl-peptidase I
VHDWLLERDIACSQLRYSPAKDWITVTLPVRQVEDLLDTKYSRFVHEDGTEVHRTEEYSLPLHLHDHIAMIQPTTSFLRPIKPAARLKFGRRETSLTQKRNTPEPADVAAVCDPESITPQCLRVFYGTANYRARAAGRNKMALNDFLGEFNNRSDMSIFLKDFRPEAAAAAFQFKQVSVAGGPLQQSPANATQLAQRVGFEGNLDAQTMMGIGWPTPLTTYSTGGRNPDFIPDAVDQVNFDEPYVAWLHFMLALPDSELPQVISSSYADNEQTVSRGYATQACRLFAQLGARGVSVIFASGDFGVGKTSLCLTNDGRNATAFLPAFPASCPYVTAVGGTRDFAPEVAAFQSRAAFQNGILFNYTSGAGFSNFFARPAYQDAAVRGYLDAHDGFPAYRGLFNPHGRAYPDLAAQSQNFTIVWNGTIVQLEGTSASAPVVAAIIALVNDALIAAGRPPLGFLNVSFASHSLSLCGFIMVSAPVAPLSAR